MADQLSGPEQPVPSRAPATVLSWETARLRQALPLLVSRVMAYSAMTRFDDDLTAAVREFYGLEMDVATAEAEILEDEDERIRFFPWFLWDFRSRHRETTIGQSFEGELAHASHERRLLDALNRSFVGFYEALENASSEGVTLRDLMTGATLHVADEGLAGDLLKNHILQARLVRVPTADGEYILVDTVYATLPPQARPAIRVELLSLTADGADDQAMKACAAEMLQFADHLLEALARPPEPRNSDDEPIRLCEAVLTGASAKAALIGIEQAPETFHQIAPGVWQYVLCDEVRSFLEKRGDRLVLAGNSLTRLDELCHTVGERFGIESPWMRRIEDFGRSVQTWAERGGGDSWLRADPEVAQAVQVWLATWARHWLDTPSPVLGGRTPRESVHDSEGRRRIEAMLARFARLQLGRLGGPPGVDLEDLRNELGLADGSSQP